MSVAWVGAGIAAAGVVSSASASKKASSALQQSASAANDTQMQMYNQTRADQQPAMDRGNAAGNQLAILLGLSSGTSAPGSLTSNDLVDTSGGDWKPNQLLYNDNPTYKSAWDSFMSGHQSRFGVAPNLSRGSDLTGVQNQLAGQINLGAINAAAKTTQESNPLFGSLNKKFSPSDITTDPSYQWRLDQGQKAIERSAAARGGVLSGAAVKAASDYNQGAASQEYAAAYDRFNNDQTTTYNRLAGIAGTGQTATAQAGQNALATGQVVGNNITGAGSAQASGYIGQANALNNGLSQGVSAYQSNQLMSKLFPPKTAASSQYGIYTDPGGATNQTNAFATYGTGYSP